MFSCHRLGRTAASCTLIPARTLSQPIPRQVLDVLAANALPACTLVPANVPLTTELWHVLRCLAYPERYTLYADYQARGG